MSIIPLPSHLHLHLNIGDIMCNCGSCCAKAPTTSIISKDLEPTTEATLRAPRNLRVVVDKNEENLKVKSALRSVAGFNRPKTENRRTLKTYYEGLVKQINEENGAGSDHTYLGHLLVQVLSARRNINLVDQYRKGKPLHIHEIARISRGMRKVHGFQPYLKELLERLATADSRENIEKGPSIGESGANPPPRFNLTRFSDDELHCIRDKVTRISQACQHVWEGCTLPVLSEEEAINLIAVAREACDCAHCAAQADA